MRRWVKSAEAPYNHRAQMSLSFFFLPFGDQRVGEAGGSKHSPGKKKQTQENTADFLLEFIFYFNRQLHILGWRCNCRFYAQNRSAGTYVTSLREFLSSLPRFRMYCHCSSDRLWPPM